jgi:hypothetical protein
MKFIENAFKKFNPKQGEFANLWKLVGVFDGICVSHDPFSVTVVAYFPTCYLKESDIWLNQMNKLIRSFLSAPTKTILNTYLLKFFESPNIANRGVSKYDLMNYLEEKRIDKLNEFDTPHYLPFITITIPVDVKYEKRDNPLAEWMESKGWGKKKNKEEGGEEEKKTLSALNQLLTTDKHSKAFKEAISNVNALIEQINQKFAVGGSGGCEKLGTSEVNAFLSHVLNHSSQRSVASLSAIFASDVITAEEEGILFYGGKYHATVSARTTDLPDNLDADFSEIYFDEAMKQIPFTVQATVSFPNAGDARIDGEKIIKRFGAIAAINSPWKKGAVDKSNQMREALDLVSQTNGRLLDFSYTIITWADTREELDENIKLFSNVLKGREFGMTRDTYNLKAAWNAQIPWMSHLNKIQTRLPSMNVEALLPLIYPPVYINKDEVTEPIWFHTKYDQITAHEAFDKRASVWNGVVVGQSGTGKSFTANYLANNAVQYNSKLFIIDKGGEGAGSFMPLIKNLGGTYVELDFSGNGGFSVNPFDGALFYKSVFTDEKNSEDEYIQILTADLEGKEDANKVTFIISILTLMVCDDENARISKTAEDFLKSLLLKAYRDYNNNEGNNLNVTIFAEDYLRPLNENPVQVDHHTKDKVKAWAELFYGQMAKYRGDGIYAHFFNSTSDIKNPDVFCFDLEGIDEHPDLKGILTSIIVNFCYLLMLDGKPERKKLLLIDEAWALLGGGKMTAVIEAIWRTIRKHGGRIYCITQDTKSIKKSPAGDAILKNSTYFYFLGSNYFPDDVEGIVASGASGVKSVSNFDLAQIKEQRFLKGQYSEFFFMNPVFKGTLRFRASPYDYWLATTDPDDKVKQNVLKTKHGADFLNREIIEELVEG